MNQIDKFAGLGMFEAAPAKPYKTALVAPYATMNPGSGMSTPTGTTEQRARSYLQANCAFCHRPDGLWPGFDVRYDVPFASTMTCNAPPGKGDQGVSGALVLTPKDPATSVLYLRMTAPVATATSGGTGRMPAIGSAVVDQQGSQLISDWINTITTCP
jgi:mono/diheme cytochrome c family protein